MLNTTSALRAKSGLYAVQAEVSSCTASASVFPWYAVKAALRRFAALTADAHAIGRHNFSG
jgi:hypothetical protein